MHTIAKIKLFGIWSYLIKRVELRFFYNAKSNTTTLKIYGRNITLDLKDLEQKYLAADCVREPENLVMYHAIANSGLLNTFIDVGANCGHVAASIANKYKAVVLFEPNPKLAFTLREMFKDMPHICIRECAIVNAAAVGHLTLTVPDDSSGLATIEGTNLSKQHRQFHTYTVEANTLEAEVENYSISNSYIKIDVEGFEANIIESASHLINVHRPIVGFEALSNKAALKCTHLFNDYVFYCARFDFLENGGALSRSVLGMLKALIFGANIVILKLDNLEGSELDNFSQIYSVPREKAEEFEHAILNYSTSNPVLNLNNLKTWS